MIEWRIAKRGRGVGPGAATDAAGCFENDATMATRLQFGRGGEAGNTGPHHYSVNVDSARYVRHTPHGSRSR